MKRSRRTLQSEERRRFEVLADRVVAGDVKSAQMTIEEREAVHVILMARELGDIVRMDRDTDGRRSWRWLPKLAQTAALLLMVPWRASAQPIVIGHNSIQNFSTLSASEVDQLEQPRVLYIDRSVGGNISSGMTCLGFANQTIAPTICRRPHPIAEFILPQETWSMVGGYSRANITVIQWDSFTTASQWYDLPTAILSYMSAHENEYDVFLWNLSYLEMVPGAVDFFGPIQPNKANVVDVESWISTHPNKKFIWATPSVARLTGTQASTDFLTAYRTYMQTRGHGVLWDVADIASHKPDGTPCYDNRDGVYYQFTSSQWENWPDDGLNLEATCQGYTTEPDGGHLGNPAIGMVREAKGFWLALSAVMNGDDQVPDTQPPTVLFSCYAFPSSQVQGVIDAQDNRGVVSLQPEGDKVRAFDAAGNSTLSPRIQCP